MWRIALMFLRSFFCLPYYLFKVFQLDDASKYDAETRYAFIHRITPKINRRGRVKVICTGIENLPKEKIDGYIKKALNEFDYSQKGKQKAGKPREKELYN